MKLTEFAIFTDAVEATAAFYERLLGRPPVHRGEGVAVFEIERVQVQIHPKYAAGQRELPGENHVAFSVPDLDGAVRTLESHGVAIQFPPRDYEWRRSAYLRDPSGNLIELVGQRHDKRPPAAWRFTIASRWIALQFAGR